MNYLLDTNACIALINGKPASVRGRFQKALETNSEVLVSAIAAFELWYGVAKSSQPEANQQRLQTFFAGPITLLPFEDEDARFAGALRGALEAIGKPIGAYDLLIAGQALRHKITLVTANISEFARIQDLDWQDWGKPPQA
ncbi:MAG TPA: type II toxin-antitoxin system VapC family toxin [Terriglobia bacterium]|nr:type II toxin-antitoxin system VapC family toxin [Terriglobia bacterium]